MDRTITMISALTACTAVVILIFFPDFYPFTSPFTAWHSTSQAEIHEPTVVSEKWNLLYHLGGNGPWIQKHDGIANGSIAVPEGCRVEQIHMVGLKT